MTERALNLPLRDLRALTDALNHERACRTPTLPERKPTIDELYDAVLRGDKRPVSEGDRLFFGTGEQS